jgi:hypothetical protein
MIVLMALNIVLQTKYAARQDTVPEVPAKDGIRFHQLIYKASGWEHKFSFKRKKTTGTNEQIRSNAKN